MADKPDDGEKIIAVNRKATHDFHIEERLECGIKLKGSEVKSCRLGKVQLVDSFASIHKGELFLQKAHIAEFAQSGPYFNHEAVQDRKLLVHKRELLKLQALIEQKGYTLIPLRFYFKKGKVKVELGLARGKTKGDKRNTQKEKDTKRQMEAAKRRER